jgi:Bacterial type II and III secretion system protein
MGVVIIKITKMKNTLLVLTSAVCLVASPLRAQIGQQMALSHSPAYEAAASPLRSAPPRQYNFSRAVLSDVMRLMAEDAGIGFFGLPEGTGNGENLVTFTLNASPFTALETLAKANGVTLIHDSGIWYLRPANDQELIGRIYEINYNAQELVTKNTQASVGGGGGGGGSSSSGGSTSSGLNLQGSPDFFVTEPSRILEDIQNILNIPTTGGNATFAPTASVDNVAQLSVGGFQGQPDLVVRQPMGGNGAAGAEGGVQSKVIWNSDSNTLYVVASRQQHQWIEAYLASADRPQPMISVEVKFLETSRDPSSDLGIDWNGVLGQNGLDVTLSDASGPINLDSVGNYSLPTAVLSYSDLTLKLRSIYNDRKTRMVSYPRMVTLDNREVSFRSVVNQPVLGSSASASLGAGATETSSIEYLPIGTVINVLPKRMAGGKILLNVSVTVSDIIGTEIINGNPFPIATSRVYTAPLTVQSGYTVAISGLDAARVDENESGLPILGRLPVIGYAFKNRKQDRNRQHLMMLITPVAIDTGTEGLTEKPITREPWKAAPIHQANYDKAPIQDSRDRLPVRAQPIADVPAFDEVADRKSSRTFGKSEDEMIEPLEARIDERSPAAKLAGGSSTVTYPDPVGVPSKAPAIGTSLNSSALAPVPSSLNTPMIVTSGPVDEAPEPVTAKFPPYNESAKPETATKPESAPLGNAAPAAPPAPVAPAKPAASPAPAAKAEAPAAKAETPAAKEETADPRLAEIRTRIDSLKGDLGKVPSGDGKLSPDDGQLVLNVHDEAQKLLEKVETVRGDKSKPLAGTLGDTWWDLINLKSQAAKLSNRSPQSLAIKSESQANGEEKPAPAAPAAAAEGAPQP